MTIAKNSGRQYPLATRVAFALADFGASGVAEAAVVLPSNAIVVGGYLQIVTAFDSGTSDSIEIGITADTDEYLTATDAQAIAVTALVPSAYKHVASDPVVLELTSVGTAATVGDGYLYIEYIIEDRATELQPE